MLISVIFLFTLSCTFTSQANAGILSAETKNNDSSSTTATPTKAVRSTDFSSGETAMLFDSKVDSFTAALNRIDASVQSLHEKSHSWAILRHHIDAWNDQMKVHEQKVELLRRSHDEQASKLMSLELTLNHILSKVIYLSDGCPQQPPTPGRTAAKQSQPQPSAASAARAAAENDSLLLQVQGEMSSRLNNILRHLQNIEKKQIEYRVTDAAVAAVVAVPSAQSPPSSSPAVSGNQMAGAMNLPIKEIKQLHSLAKKNAKLLEHILQEVSGTDEHCDSVVRNLNRRIDAVSGELATFTGSSDLLLKRIESLLRIVALKTDQPQTKSNEHDGDESEPNDEDDEGTMVESEAEADEQEHEHVEEQHSETNDNEVDAEEDVNDKVIKTSSLDANEVEENEGGDTAASEMHMFLKPTKHHCHELNRNEAESGIYIFDMPQLNEANRDFNMRLCVFGNPFLDDGPAWTVIQNRGPYETQENFNRSWAEYRNGFGSLERDFWYGNEFVHQLLENDNYVLRIEVTDDQGSYGWAEYIMFRLDSEEYNYNLMIGGFSSNGLPDALQFNNELDFSTYDRRNDKSVDACCPCAVTYASGWWFDRCSEVNLNGIYRDKPSGHNYVGIIWQDWPYEDYSLRSTRMMIRPRSDSYPPEDP